MREPEPEQSDEEIAELVRGMRADRPDLDWDNLLMGRLAGPASEDRPAVPVWDYPAAAAADPGISMEDLTAARFPVRYVEGGWSVTSVDEELKPFPSSYKGPHPTPRFQQDAMSVIRRYRLLHDAGVIAWDPDSRGLTYLQPLSVYREALRAWADDEANRDQRAPTGCVDSSPDTSACDPARVATEGDRPMASSPSNWNDRVIEEFRANNGTVARFGRNLVLIHHIGAKTGAERVAPVRAIRDGSDSWLIAASKAGAPDNPAWYYNLIANPDVLIETPDDGTVPVRAEVLRGDERDEAWERFKEASPGFRDYEQKTSRTIPVVALRRRAVQEGSAA